MGYGFEYVENPFESRYCKINRVLTLHIRVLHDCSPLLDNTADIAVGSIVVLNSTIENI